VKRNSMRAAVFAALVIVGYTSSAEDNAWGQDRYREALVKWKLNSLRRHEGALREFLKEMPKGADLHSHLSGAVTTERLIEWGGEDGLCVDTTTFTATPPPCTQGQVPLADALSDPTLYNNVLAAWSMEGFQGTLLEAHQHFFDTFGKFGTVLSDARTDDALADVLSIAGKNHQIYVELMQSFGSSDVGRVASNYILLGDPWDEGYLLEKRAQIMADPVFSATRDAAKTAIENEINGARELLGCDTPNPDPGCNVEVRFIVQATRTGDRGFVFAQWVYGFELAQIVPQVVGVNLVAPEEHPNSLLYYDDEMFALDVLRRFNQQDPTRRSVRISLHAGELIPEVLPMTPEGQRHLTFHIRHAVEIAHAARIGHGVDVLKETEGDGVRDLLRKMRDADVMVEICLTSNAILLGKEGKSHPLRAYLKHHVPVALSTDDQGIFRIDITDEFVQAVIKQSRNYRTLKDMVRTSLEHSFLSGPSLWEVPSHYDEVTNACTDDVLGDPQPSADCAQLLADSERAAMQWKLEAEFNAFEDALVNN
jgi:adenosine deaminase